MSKKSRKEYWSKMQSKKAWFQGQTEKSVEGPVTSNNPEALGYPKEMGYDKKPMETTVGGDSRDWEQKWFENAAAETKPNLGPSGEEFKLKVKMQRIPSDEKIANAKLSAKFHAVKGSPKTSSWTILADGEPILNSTLDQIWGDELDEKTAKQTATKEYAKSVMAKIRQKGFSHVAYLLTGAQFEGGVDGGAEGADLDVNDALDNEAAMTVNELGVASDIATEKKEEIENLEVQIVEKVDPSGEAVEVFKGLEEAEKALEGTATELNEIKAKLTSKTLTAAKKIAVIKIAEAAIADAVATFEAADEEMDSAEDMIPEGDIEEDITEEVSEGEVPAIVEEKIQDAKDFLEGGAAPEVTNLEGDAPVAEVAPEAGPVAEDVTTISSANIKKFVSARKARREALAAMKEEQKYNVTPDGAPKDGADEVKRAHPEGGHDVTNLTAGGKPKDNGKKFETIEEAQKIDVEVAVKTPKGTYSANAKGKVSTASEEHAVDAEAKNYWVKYFSQMGPEGKAFGEALVADHSDKSGSEIGKAAKSIIEKQVTSAVEIEKGKLLRANELAEQAAGKGMIENTVKAKMELVATIMDGGDKFFSSYKAAVEKNPGRRTVSAEDLGVRTASVKALKVGQVELQENSEADDISSQLSKFNWS